jgi:hypothetical protein
VAPFVQEVIHVLDDLRTIPAERNTAPDPDQREREPSCEFVYSLFTLRDRVTYGHRRFGRTTATALARRPRMIRYVSRALAFVGLTQANQVKSMRLTAVAVGRWC